MSLTEANIALRDSLSADYTFFEGCDFVTPAGLPQGVSFMVLNDTIVRVDVRTAGVPTEAGVRVGDNEAQVMERYKGRVRVEPHKYTGPTGRYLIVDSPQDTVYRLVLETDGERITRYRAGLRAAADLVEGCA